MPRLCSRTRVCIARLLCMLLACFCKSCYSVCYLWDHHGYEVHLILCAQYAGPSETAAIFASLPGSVEVPLGVDGALDPDTVAVPAEAAAGAAEVAMQGAARVFDVRVSKALEGALDPDTVAVPAEAAAGAAEVAMQGAARVYDVRVLWLWRVPWTLTPLLCQLRQPPAQPRWPCRVRL